MPLRARPVAVADRQGTLIAVLICIGLLIAIVPFRAAELFHWFVIPVFSCGVLCCRDALLLFDGQKGRAFSPVPMLGLYGIFFFYIGPLLHVTNDYWFVSKFFAPSDYPEDWRPWLGWMGIVNLVGLLIYNVAYRYYSRRRAGSAPRFGRALNFRVLQLFGGVLLCVTLGLQIYLIASFGGFLSFLDVFDNSIHGQGSGFEGLGWVFCISESFPLLMVILIVAVFRDRLSHFSSLRIGMLLAVLFGMLLLFGGMRGSRSNTVIAFAYAVGIIHLMVRRLSWRFYASCTVAAAVFMYMYGFYKVSRLTFFDALTSSEEREVLGGESGRTFEAVLLGDLERSDIQADILYRVTESNSDIQYAWGRTYVDGVFWFIPRFISSYRPPGKALYGTNALFGLGKYAPNTFVATKIYGLAGESMLNFGVVGVPIGFLILGAIVGRLTRFIDGLPSWDARWYLVPIFSISCIILLSSDLDNVLFTLLQHALLPAILIFVGSKGWPLHGPRPALPNPSLSRLAPTHPRSEIYRF